MDGAPGDRVQADDVGLLFEQYHATVYRVCRARTASVEEAQDAVQETFIQLLQADRSGIAIPQAWLIAIAMKVCWRIRRVRIRRDETELFDGCNTDPEVDPAEPALDNVWVERLA